MTVPGHSGSPRPTGWVESTRWVAGTFGWLHWIPLTSTLSPAGPVTDQMSSGAVGGAVVDWRSHAAV